MKEKRSIDSETWRSIDEKLNVSNRHSNLEEQPQYFSKYDKAESLFMETHALLESMQGLIEVVEECSPDRDEEEEFADIFVRIPTDTWGFVKKAIGEQAKKLETIVRSYEAVEASCPTEFESTAATKKEIEVLRETVRKKDIALSELKLEHKAIIDKHNTLYCEALAKLSSAYDTGVKTMNEDFTKMKKAVRSLRRLRRHVRAKQVTHLQKAEMEFEDMISSSEDPLGFSRIKRDSQVITQSYIFENDLSHCDNLFDSPAHFDETPSEGSNLPKMALGGVIILENGEPLGIATSDKWLSEYDETNSDESSGFLRYLNDNPTYNQAEDTVQKNLMVQLLSDEYKTKTANSEERLRRRAERKKARESAKKDAGSQLQESSHALKELPQNSKLIQENPSLHSSISLCMQKVPETSYCEEAKLEDLFKIPGPKFEAPLPEDPSIKPSKNEKLNHITEEDIMKVELENSCPVSLDNSLPEDELIKNPLAQPTPLDPTLVANPEKDPTEKNQIFDLNSQQCKHTDHSKNQIVKNRVASQKKEEQKPSKRRIEPILIKNSCQPARCQSVTSRSSKSNQQHTELLAAETPKIESRPKSVMSTKYTKNILSFRSSRCLKTSNDKFMIPPHPPSRVPPILYTEQKRNYQTIESKQGPHEEEKIGYLQFNTQDEEKEDIDTPLPNQRERTTAKLNHSNSMSIKGMTKTNVSQGEYSINFSADPSKGLNKLQNALVMRRTRLDPLSVRLSPEFWAQLAEECKGTDQLTLSTAGVIFGAGLLSEYSNIQLKSSMFQSFCTNKPTPLSLLHGPQQNSSSIVFRSFNEKPKRSSEKKMIKVKKRGFVPTKLAVPEANEPFYSRLHILLGDGKSSKKVFKHLKLLSLNKCELKLV